MPAPYRLYFFIRNSTPKEFSSIFEQISYSAFFDSNVEVEIINVNQKADHPAIEYFNFWEIQSFPSAVLVSPDGRSLVLPISFSNQPFRETVRFLVENVVSSPKREEILKHIVKSYCVILLIEGEGLAGNENKRVHNVVNETAQKIAVIMNQLPKHIDEPPNVIVIPRESFYNERVLLWSLDINYNKVNEPCVAVLYGRGRKIGPVLEGEQITGSVLFNILSLIGLSCECGLDKRWMMGTMLPLRWGKKIQSDVVNFLGFDAESPMIKMEMSSILSLGQESIREPIKPLNEYSENVLAYKNVPSVSRLSPAQLHALSSTGSDAEQSFAAEDKRIIKNSENMPDRNSEEVLAKEREQVTARLSPTQFHGITSSESAVTKSGLNFKTTLAVFCIIVVLIFAVGLFILLRVRRRVS